MVAGWSAWALPFFPTGWPFGLAALAAAVSIVNTRLGLAFALGVPILPLGNLALGAAALYALVALALLAAMWREPERGLLFSLGALLAPIAGLGLFPLADGAIYSCRAASTPPDRTYDDVAELKRRFSHWHDPIPEILDSVDAAHILPDGHPRGAIARLQWPLRPEGRAA